MLSKEKTLLRLPCHLQKFIEWKRNSSLTLQTTLTVCATHKTAYCCSTSIPSKVGRDVKSQPRNPAQQTNPGNYCPRLPPPLASLHQFQVWLWILDSCTEPYVTFCPPSLGVSQDTEHILPILWLAWSKLPTDYDDDAVGGTECDELAALWALIYLELPRFRPNLVVEFPPLPLRVEGKIGGKKQTQFGGRAFREKLAHLSRVLGQ